MYLIQLAAVVVGILTLGWMIYVYFRPGSRRPNSDDTQDRSPTGWWLRSAKSVPVLSLPRYIESLRKDIQNNLVKEVFKQDKYQEHCIDPFVRRKGDNRSDGFPAYRLAEFRYSAILGEPGTGKTTTLRLLALHLLEAQRMQVLPLLISLGSYTRRPNQTDEERKTAFEGYLDDRLRRLQCPPISRLNSSDDLKLLFLLDGLDQMDDDAARDDTRLFLDGIAEHSFVVTSRPECQHMLPQCDRYEVVPVSLERLPEFVRRRIKRRDTIEWFLERVVATPSIHRLASNPLTLSIMTVLLEDEDRERGPGKRRSSEWTKLFGNLNRAQLCDRVIECILQRKHRRGEESYTALPHGLTVSDVEHVLLRLAYDSIAGRWGSPFVLNEDQIEKAAWDSVRRRIPNISGLLAGTLGIIRDKGASGYEFFLPWYQEFLAAKHIILSSMSRTDSVGNTPPMESMLSELENPKLAACLQYIVGLRWKDIDSEELMEEVEIHDPFNYCRAISQGEFSDEVKHRLIVNLLRKYEDRQGEFPARVVMARALAEAELASRNAIFSVAQDETVSSYGRRAALEAYSILESHSEEFHKLLPNLPDYSQRSKEEAKKRLEAEKEQFDGLLIKLLEGAVDLQDPDEAGLLWHVIEHVGWQTFTDSSRQSQAIQQLRRLSRLDGFKTDEEWVTTGDAIWALTEITPRDYELPDRLIQGLYKALDRDGEHVQGHALRTIGRLKIRGAIPKLHDYLLHHNEAGFKWIVPQAAAMIGGEGVLELLCDAIETASSSLVVAAALHEIGRRKGRIPERTIKVIEGYTDNRTQVHFLEQTLGSIALVALDNINKEI